jgi:group I intron endonuclease
MTVVLVYSITNSVNGKRYIGITANPRRRWKEHRLLAERNAPTAMASAIRQYGLSSFQMEIIACCLSRQDAHLCEQLLIKQEGTKAPGGYNLTDGGDGVFGLVPEIVERVAAINRGRKISPEVVARRAAKQKGLKRSPEFGARISAARSGKPLSEEHKAKLAARKLGVKQPPRTPEHSARISEGLKRAHARRRAAECQRTTTS